MKKFIGILLCVFTISLSAQEKVIIIPKESAIRLAQLIESAETNSNIVILKLNNEDSKLLLTSLFLAFGEKPTQKITKIPCQTAFVDNFIYSFQPRIHNCNEK